MPSAKSVIISCAGTGSRLGLATTKALVEINGKKIIEWQLDMLKNVEDIRIVVGFQANEVVDVVKKIRNDVVFVYNHNYFDTKTGYSYYLGAKDGREYALELDGDLIVHPLDMKMLLELEGEWIAYSKKQSENPVFANVNDKKEVIGFSKTDGDFEWTGPCVLKRDKIQPEKDFHVFNQLEPYLPMRGVEIRAFDIDTYDDYKKASAFL